MAIGHGILNAEYFKLWKLNVLRVRKIVTPKEKVKKWRGG